MMEVLGFIVYMVCTLFASFLCVAVWSWPGTGKGEGLTTLAIAGLLWYGAWYFNPFTITMT